MTFSPTAFSPIEYVTRTYPSNTIHNGVSYLDLEGTMHGYIRGETVAGISFNGFFPEESLAGCSRALLSSPFFPIQKEWPVNWFLFFFFFFFGFPVWT